MKFANPFALISIALILANATSSSASPISDLQDCLGFTPPNPEGGIPNTDVPNLVLCIPTNIREDLQLEDSPTEPEEKPYSVQGLTSDETADECHSRSAATSDGGWKVARLSTDNQYRTSNTVHCVAKISPGVDVDDVTQFSMYYCPEWFSDYYGTCDITTGAQKINWVSSWSGFPSSSDTVYEWLLVWDETGNKSECTQAENQNCNWFRSVTSASSYSHIYGQIAPFHGAPGVSESYDGGGTFGISLTASY